MSGSRGMPVFQNAVVLGGRLVKAPETVRNENDDQIRFTLAHPYRKDRAYFIEITVFGELATLMRDGDADHQPFDKGDRVLIKGRLTSYSKGVKGATGTIQTTRVTVVAEHVTRQKAGTSAGRPKAPAPAHEPEPGFDDE